MRKALLYPALILTATTLACEPALEAVGPEETPQFARSERAPAHHVSGGGQVDYTGTVADGADTETYGVTASMDGAGNVKGQFESHWGEYRFHMEITCLAVDGNRAWLGGVTTRSNNESFPVGHEWVFSVVDNGQGANADPDQLSYFYFLDASDCTDPGFDFYYFDWTNGNVKVK
jgi:hypothetical protein